jgi:outer membrane protein assembly factor BamB
MFVALERETGKLVWRAERPPRESFVSDPLLVQEKLAAFTITRGEQQQNTLQLVTLDPETGETLAQHEVLRLRDSWWTRRYFAAAALDDSLIASLAGATLCCDASGNLRWIRTQTVLPAEEESSWVTQRFQPPLVHGGRLYVAQPGVRMLECLDPDSGDAHWTRVLPGVQGILGFAAGRVIVESNEGLTALDAQTGQSAWRRQIDDRLDAALCDDTHILLASSQPRRDSDHRRVALVWLNPADGAQQGEAEIPQLEHRFPYLAALVADDNRLLAFFGGGEDEPRRELVEFSK